MDSVSAAETTLTLTTRTSDSSPGSYSLTYSAAQTELAVLGDVWKPNWTVLGRFQYQATFGGDVVARWNVSEELLVSDRDTGIVYDDGTNIVASWAGGDTWVAVDACPFFTGSLDTSGFVCGETFTLSVADAGEYRQVLEKSGSSLLWKQDTFSQGTYFALGTRVFEASGATPPTRATVKGTYDTSTGNMAWDTAWTGQGLPLSLPAQSLMWQPGQSSVLYLHFENLLAPENSKGPNPYSSTCAAKLSLDPTAPVNNIVQTRAHRWVEIPPGTISQVKFFVRMGNGQPVNLIEMGCSISFILTIAPRGSG